MADTQTCQKQPTIFQNKKLVLLGKTRKEKLPHYYKNIGLGIKTPKAATEGTYMSICDHILSGVVTKMKMQHIIVICQGLLALHQQVQPI